MNRVSVTLVKAGGERWFAGEFPNEAAADDWIAIEQAKHYWDEGTTVDKVVIVEPVIPRDYLQT